MVPPDAARAHTIRNVYRPYKQKTLQFQTGIGIQTGLVAAIAANALNL